MSTNLNPALDWSRLLSTEVRKLDTYVQTDPDQQWIQFQRNLADQDVQNGG